MVAAKRCLSTGRLASLRPDFEVVGVVQAGLGTQQQIALLVLLDVGALVVGAQHRKAFVAPLQNRLELATIAAVDVASEDMPGLGCATERDANLDRTLEQSTQPRAALEDHVAGEFDLGH